MGRVIRIQGARQHNLKNIDVVIPRDRMVVITGLSGSGKSSLAFDTIYAEGQRKYVESLSAYARQFLEQMSKPDVDHIEGLPPTIAIEQRSAGGSPRSTVATTTEIYDYLRLLYARVGTPYCWKCSRQIQSQTVEQIADSVLSWPEGTRIHVLSPLIRGQKGEHKDVFRAVQRQGFVRVRVDSQLYDVHEIPELAKNRKHTIEAVVDRLVVRPSVRTRLADSLEIALKLSDGLIVISRQLAEQPSNPKKSGRRSAKKSPDGWTDHLYSERYACPVHTEASLPELSPRLFSFNSPYGACSDCDGLGTILEFDPDLIISDPQLSLSGGVIEAWRHGGKRMNIFYNRLIRQFCRRFGVSPDTPYNRLSKEIRQIILYGTDPDQSRRFGASFEGAIPNLTRRWRSTDSEHVKTRLHGYISAQPCRLCHGHRLRTEALHVKIAGLGIHEIVQMTIWKAQEFFNKLELDAEKQNIAAQVLKEIRSRLGFMADVGIGYLSLDRTSSTLSGGEAQRIRLATQVGSGLVGVCYVLDEPTIGLHQRDNCRLLETLRSLTDIGNTVLIVEHDEETIRSADHIIDVGPGAGAHGGWIVAQGDLETVLKSRKSSTANYLSGRQQIKLPSRRRRVSLTRAVTVKSASENNLKDIDVKFPLGVFCCVTGVSGSGKSTLVTQTLLRALRRRIYGSHDKPGKHARLLGTSAVDKVIQIDQSPIGRTPRSNPATYTGVFDLIRQLFARTREAKIRGYKAGRFSFNVKGGRCEVCRGQGTRKIEMHFLPDVYVVCQECKAQRYNRETLEIRYKGKNIADVLDMRVEDALSFFTNFPKIKQLLRALNDVGLGYMTLGQASTTLSGGEAQRVKLATELGKTSTGHTFYVLDEPTTGLHFADIHNLLNVLNRLVDLGNTVVVIEHNMDVIKHADYIVDLGPEGGDAGGRVVAQGRPEEIVKVGKSYTGQFLKAKIET
ncbi:MAG: excinuclease ABC subunit UvrA [Actinobacteria bacterium]|nr:excinuclease ABC subunit UvrA [Actinomycetota bacterium]